VETLNRLREDSAVAARRADVMRRARDMGLS
jgi:hypothetical protein